MNTEKITYEIQQMKATKAVKNGASETAPPPSIADTTLTEEDGKSIVSSLQSESGVHASQIATPTSTASAEGGAQPDGGASKARKTKRQLWDDVTISGECCYYH